MGGRSEEWVGGVKVGGRSEGWVGGGARRKRTQVHRFTW